MHDIWNPWHGCRKASEGWDNVMLNVTCENQRRADERLPVLLATPARHKGVMCAPLIGRVDVERYLGLGGRSSNVRGCGIEQVVCGGENYEGSRPCDFDWVRLLAAEHYATPDVTADACVGCSHCNSRCPFGVDQVARMREIAAHFGR